MSEPTQITDADRAGAAPLPWLADRKTTAETPVQTWQVTAPGDVLFAVSYRYRIPDYIRCTFSVYVLRWLYHAIGALTTGLAVATTVTAMYWRPGRFLAQVITFLLAFVALSGVLLLLFITVMLVIVPVAALVLLPLRVAPMRLLVEMYGVHDIPRGKGMTYPWKDIGGIVLRDGDIIIVSKTIMSEGRYVPRTAFASADAASRFHAALVAVWEASGNPAVLTDAVLAEFAPTPNTGPAP